MSGGGTAGHIYPALAVADKLKKLGHEVLFVGTPQGLEARLVPSAGVDFVALKAEGFNRSKPWTLFTSGAEVALSSLKARRILSDFKADAVVGFGGYVSIPVGLAAAQMHVPLVIHEQNSVPGMTNKYLAKRAGAICLTYPDTQDIIENVARSGASISVTGNPVRSSVLAADRTQARASLGLTDDDILVFVFGGSRGARHINNALIDIVPELLENEHVHIIHATGSGEYESVLEKAKSLHAGDRYQPQSYIENMGAILAASDIAVCRAGATSIAELTALGVAAILVPYPYATDDHQTKNARAMVNHKAALLIPDDQLDEELRPTLLELVENKGKRILMAQQSLVLGQRNSAQLLVDSIYSVVE